MRDYYRQVSEVVSQCTGFTEVQILHDRHEVCTDARYLLVHFLSDKLKCNEIVHLTGLSKQTVSQIVNQYDTRAKYKYSLRATAKMIECKLFG